MRVWGAAPGEEPTARIPAFLDDYAYLIHGLLTLHEATQEPRWLEEARALTDRMITWHRDDAGGGFFATAHDHDKLFARAKDQFDGAQPSGNSMAALGLVRLAKATGDPRYRGLARQTLQAFGSTLTEHPGSVPTMVVALDEYLALADPEPTDPPKDNKSKRSDRVVKVTVKAEKPNAQGMQTIIVTFKIDKGYHIYANPVGNETLKEAQTVVTVASDVKPLTATLTYPPGKDVKDDVVGSYRIYEGEVMVRVEVQRAASDATSAEVTARFMACTDKTCLLPAAVKLAVP
jgi:uncharacterized protein YyaL (SSP411 family)